MEQGFEKRFKSGDIVYFHSQEGNRHFVNYGMVDEQFSDVVCIDLLEVKETRLINSIPIDEVPNIGKWNKIPKGWSWDTKLFETTYAKEDWMNEKIDIKDPEQIKAAYEKGYLVKSDTKFHGNIEDEITKDGWRIVKKHPMYRTKLVNTSIRSDKVYFTYQEAEKEVNAITDEIKRISELSDYEWSVEQIDKVLDRAYYLTKEERYAYREWFLKLKYIEDLEVRL